MTTLRKFFQRLKDAVMSLLFGSTSVLPTAAPTSEPVPVPPAPPPASGVVVDPTISGNNKDIGVVLTRTIGTYATGWTPVAGQWNVVSTGTIIGYQATQATDNVGVGDYVVYRETISKSGEVDQYAYSLPYGPFVAGAPAPAPAPGSTTLYSADTLVADQTTANDNAWHIAAAPNTANNNGPSNPERYAYIHQDLRSADGQNHYSSLYLDGHRLGGLSVISFTASQSMQLLPWYVVGRASQDSTGSANTRVQLRNLKFFAMRMDNTWETLATTAEIIGGSQWHANFSAPGNETYLPISDSPGTGAYDWRYETAANGGGSSIGSIGYGGRYDYALHGFESSATKSASTWYTDYRGFVFVLEGRLILEDPNGTDDRDSSGLMVWPGADWKKDGTWCGEIGHGRLKLLTKDWKIFSHTTVTPLSRITQYKPPGYS